MNYLTNTYNYLSYYMPGSIPLPSSEEEIAAAKEEKLDNNAAVISHFVSSRRNPRGMIKADSEGNLYWADKGMKWAKGYLKGTILEDTTTILDDCVTQLFEKHKNSIHLAAQELLLGIPAEKVEFLSTLIADEIKEEIKLLIGVKNIHEVYAQRYSNKPKKAESVKQLSALQEKVSVHVKVLQDLARELKNPIAEHIAFTATIPTEDEIRISLEESLKAAENLDSFCAAYNKEISTQKARALIQEGKKLYKKIISAESTQPDAAQGAKEHQLAALTWFLTQCTINKKQGFSNGALMIEDKEGKLYAFLKSAAGADGTRKSSHFTGRSPVTQIIPGWGKTSIQYGIDVTNGEMPSKKRTILFEQIPNMNGSDPSNMLFYKIEAFSPFLTTGYGYDAIWHLYELFVSQGKSFFNPEGHEEAGMRKEKVPVFMTNLFKKLHKELSEKQIDPSKNDELLDKPLEKVKTYGIAFINRYITALEGMELAQNIDLAGIKTEIRKYDNFEIRTGREVILRTGDLV